MKTVNYSTLRSNLKSYCDMVIDEEETLIVTRRANRDVVLISMDEYNRLTRLARYASFAGDGSREADYGTRTDNG